MKVLITGGAGYIGNILATYLKDAGHEVTVYDTLRYGTQGIIHLLNRGVRIIQGDVLDSEKLRTEVVKCDAVFHLASLVGFPLCRKYPEEARNTIVKGTLNLTTIPEIVYGNVRLIFASTGSIYGKIDDICLEDTVPNPQSDYGKWKYQADRLVQEVGGVSLRFATLFGLSPVMRYDLLPNDFCWRAGKHGYIVLYRGTDRRTFLHVHDAVRAYERTLENYSAMRGQVYNVGDSNLNFTKKYLADTIQSLQPFNLISENVGDDPDFRDYEVNYDKFSTATGFHAQVSLKDGLTEVLNHVKIADMNLSWRLNV